MIEFDVNGAPQRLEVPSDMPLLWAIRDSLRLPGTKFGCGMGLCGACTVHVDGQPTRSCVTPVSAVAGRRVTTIEGLAEGDRDGRDVARLHPVQQAWIEASVAQCGYCQSGQIMSAAALVEANPDPTDAEIDRALAGNLCRCGTYPRIRAAVRRAAELKRNGETVVQNWDPDVQVAALGGLPA